MRILDHGDLLLKIEGVSKTFPGVRALDGVDFRVRKGTIHALLGENGAGKSTLMKVLLGIYTPDSGSITFKGQTVQISNTHQALKMGISMIHQELSPFLDMSVGDNVFLGREPMRKMPGFVNENEVMKRTQELFGSLGFFGISPKSLMKDLSVAQMQLVEIAKAVSYNADLIIMDEPTSALSETEVKSLFKIICSLKKKGIAVIYISHKLEEIFEIADEISVLRDGKNTGTDIVKNLDRQKLIQMMVGRELKELFHKEKTSIGEVVLEVKDLGKEGLFKDINFKLHRGEILGVAGLMGSGRSEIFETIFGVRGKYSGCIYKEGKQIRIRNSRDAIKHKIALVPEDRKIMGLMLCLSIRMNISISHLNKLSRFSFIKASKEKSRCNELSKSLQIKAESLETITSTLSGGNQQKVVLAKWLLTAPDILIFDEPTRGIDVGAKSEIYSIMIELAKQGKSMIIISSELPEVLGVSDRIIVVHNGRLTGELSREEATQEKIMDLASI